MLFDCPDSTVELHYGGVTELATMLRLRYIQPYWNIVDFLIKRMIVLWVAGCYFSIMSTPRFTAIGNLWVIKYKINTASGQVNSMNNGYIGEHLCNGKTVLWFFGFAS